MYSDKTNKIVIIFRTCSIFNIMFGVASFAFHIASLRFKYEVIAPAFWITTSWMVTGITNCYASFKHQIPVKNEKYRFSSAVIVLSSLSVVSAVIGCLGGICFSCYGGRILEWGLNVFTSIFMLICNIMTLIFTVIPVCFSHRRTTENFENSSAPQLNEIVHSTFRKWNMNEYYLSSMKSEIITVSNTIRDSREGESFHYENLGNKLVLYRIGATIDLVFGIVTFPFQINALRYKYVMSAPSLWVASIWTATGIVISLASFKRPPPIENIRSKYRLGVLVVSTLSLMCAVFACLGGACYACFEGRIIEWYMTAFTGIVLLITNMSLFICSLIVICLSHHQQN